jgi:hypothetical protein
LRTVNFEPSTSATMGRVGPSLRIWSADGEGPLLPLLRPKLPFCYRPHPATAALRVSRALGLLPDPNGSGRRLRSDRLRLSLGQGLSEQRALSQDPASRPSPGRSDFPRATTRSIPFDRSRCSSFGTPCGAVIQASNSSGSVRSTGMAVGWIGAASVLGSVVKGIEVRRHLALLHLPDGGPLRVQIPAKQTSGRSSPWPGRTRPAPTPRLGRGRAR